jgi:beta-xylosidase
MSLQKSLTKLEMEPEDGPIAAQGGIMAPSIRYHDGTFYVICTIVDHKAVGRPEPKDYHNFIVSTTDIWADEWSAPVFYDFYGIDTSLFWDDDGRVYVIDAANAAPETKIHQFEIDLKTGAKLSEERMLWEGVTNVFPEGPHMYKRDGWYYLLIAEGGCFADHHVTMARSRDIWGPYEVNPANPVLPKSDPNGYIQYTGHGDLVQDPSTGQWYFVCLGVRKNSGRFVMGRESVITTATWPEGEFPVIDAVQVDVPFSTKRNTSSEWPNRRQPGRPDVGFVRIRDPVEEDYEYNGDSVTLMSRKADLSQSTEPVTFIGKRQRRLDGTAAATLEPLNPLGAKGSGLRAGLCYYKDEHRLTRVFLDFEAEEIVLEVYNKANSIARKTSRHIDALENSAQVTFGVDYTELDFVFWYCVNEGSKNEFEKMDTLDMTNHEFVGPVIGVYAVSDKQCKLHFSHLILDGF